MNVDSGAPLDHQPHLRHHLTARLADPPAAEGSLSINSLLGVLEARAIVKCCGSGPDRNQAATFSSGVVGCSSGTRIPSLKIAPARTSVTSSWPLKRRQRSSAVLSSL